SRKLLMHSITRRSFHVGEDFPHLLTGIRHMLDALELLDLRDGDRIGHGTAMGISPSLWVERMPGKLKVRRGEWMLDLLAAWRLMRQYPSAGAQVERVAVAISGLASTIFQRQVDSVLLERVMQLRHLDARFVQRARDPKWDWRRITSRATREEGRLVAMAVDADPDAVNLLWTWLSDRTVWRRSEALLEVDAAYFEPDTFILLQQALMHKVMNRGVIIETLPSSNVRISLYKSFDEHHALRWMRVPGALQEGDPEIMVSLGSDDPGIFAGDLGGEFYQLYSALRNRGIGDKAALDYLKPLNECGRTHRFHHSSLG
ncbi:hypothetical protein D769_13416, partial [Cupriavidus sp. HMR-1]